MREFYTDNVSNNSILRNEFLRLDLKNRHEINTWLKKRHNEAKNLEGDYFIADVSNEYSEIDNVYSIHETIGEFIENQSKLITFTKNNNLKIIGDIYEKEHFGDILFSGIIDIQNGCMTITDIFKNVTCIKNRELFVDSIVISKILYKHPKLPSFTEFISQIKDNGLLVNCFIRITTYDSTSIPPVLKIVNGEIINIEQFDKFENSLISGYKVTYVE